MLSIKEKEERKKQIGASEIHLLFNFDTQTCQDLWESKIGLCDSPDIENDSMIAGNILEEDCLKYYEKINNCELALNERIEHKKIKGLIASLDAREKETSIPIENKVVNERTYESWIAKKTFNAICGETKLNIPRNYYCQIQTQIMVCEVELGKLNINTLTDEEQYDPINVIITELHNKVAIVYRDDVLITELEKRAKYMLECMSYKRRPSEQDYLERKVF